MSTNLRGVDDESVPLALDVIIRRLFGDVKPIKLNLPGDLLLPLKDHHRNLEEEPSRECSSAAAWLRSGDALTFRQ